MRVQVGSVLLEVMTTAVLLALLGTMAATLIHSEALLMRNTSDHIASDEALTSAQAIVTAELRNTASPDVHAIGRDSLALRVFRGRGIVCTRGSEPIHIRYRGLRELNGDKDSLLNVRTGQAALFRLTIDRDQRCSPGHAEAEVTIATALPLDAGDVLLFFESGTYYLGSNALRYRRGSEGKQPLTDEQIDDRASLFARDNDRGLRLFLKAKGAASAAFATDVRLRFLNNR